LPYQQIANQQIAAPSLIQLTQDAFENLTKDKRRMLAFQRQLQPVYEEVMNEFCQTLHARGFTNIKSHWMRHTAADEPAMLLDGVELEIYENEVSE
jgi:hypothetical protein